MSTDIHANNVSILSLGSGAVVEAESVENEGNGGPSVGGSPLGWGVSRFRQVLASSSFSVNEGGVGGTPPRDTLASGGPYIYVLSH
jgi:hypothetical protein